MPSVIGSKFHVSTIDLSEHVEADYPLRWSIFPIIDGDRVVVPVTFHDADYAPTPLSKLVIYNATTDEVTVDTSTQCGSLSRSAVDDEGNVYWASSFDIAAGYALDASASFADDQTFAPCMMRMAAGADGWDDDYFVDLTSLTDDARPAHAIMTGNGDVAYTAIFDPSDVGPISEDSARSNAWAFHSVELGNEAAGATVVPDAEPTNHRPSFGSFVNESNELVGWIMTVNDEFTETTLPDTSSHARSIPVEKMGSCVWCLVRGERGCDCPIR